MKYKEFCEQQGEYESDTKEYKNLEVKKKEIGKKLNALYEQYGLTKDNIRQLSIEFNKKHPINSVFALSIFEDVWQALSDLLYRDGKMLHFKSRTKDQPSIRAKQVNRGIVFNTNENDELTIKVGKARGSNREEINLLLKPCEKHDFFLMEELEKMIDYLKNENNGLVDIYKRMYETTNEKQDTYRPCFAKIVFKKIRHKTRVYIQFTLVGKPLQKKDRHGNTRHVFKNGKLGFDLNTQTVDFVGENYVFAANLAERNNRSTKDTENELKNILRKMDKSRRKTNPQNYKPDGTIKKGTKEWVKSNRYKKLEYKLKEKYRRDALFREYANEEIANKQRCHGNILITEKNNVSAWQKRSKKPTEDTDKIIEKQDKDGTTKKIKKKKRKKRFGRSILHRCPGGFIAICKNKFDEIIYVDIMFRASQYDHTCNQYIKKKLSNRRFMLMNGVIVQRDLYSAFLLYCANIDYTEPDRKLCLANFDSFYKEFLVFEKYIEENNIHIENYN